MYLLDSMNMNNEMLFVEEFSEHKYDLAFYTYFYGSNSNPAFKIPDIPSDEYDCYYFTNNKDIFEQLKTTKWIGIYDDKQTNDDMIESNMIGKHIKSCPHAYEELKGYAYLCFLDSKLDKLNIQFILNLIDSYFVKQNYALLLREHWFVDSNVWSEYNLSMHQERYRLQEEQIKEYIYKQLENGLSETTKYHCACGLLLRNMKHDNIIDLNETWYNHIQKCGIQDQISFFFVKQLFHEIILAFKENPFV